MKNLILFFFIAFGALAFSQTKPKQKTVAADYKFNFQIQGKVLDNCNTSSNLTFGVFNGSDTEVETIKTNANGEFLAGFWLREPGLVYFKKGSNTQYFMVNPKERTYKIYLSCNNNELNPLHIENSKENKAYQDFVNLRKKLSTDLEEYSTKNLNDTTVFKEFCIKLRDFQKKSIGFAKQYPQTYAANNLVVADRINEKDFSSIQNLRQNYLKRQIFADQKFYNTPLPTFILENYIDLIIDKNENSFAAFEWVLNTASKNIAASKRLQHLLYEAFSKSKRQDLIDGYIYWAKANPEKMVQQVVQAKLEALSKSMVDANFINVSLKDTIGNTRELKDVVTSSKFTLLVIYNPDCSHCVETLPKLIPIWQQYQSKGFIIYTVAAFSKNEEWIDFIKKHTGTGWVNVMEDQTNSNFGKYSITSLPSFILIDSKGKIVSRMAAGNVKDDMEKWLSSH